MLKLWAERDNKVLDYMFYFDMRETSDIRKDTSLEDLLFSVFSEPDEGKEEVLQDIKQNCDNVTLIFDGVTDLCSSSVVKRLVEKDLLPDATVIVTCRQDDEEEFASEDYLRVEVKGFSEQTIKTYLSAMLGEEQKKVLSNVELLTLCHVPMYALMVAVCFSFETPEDSPQPCTITEIYINIVRICLQINSKNMKKRNLNDFIKNKSKEILSLAEAAFHATEGKTVNLIERLFEDSCVLCFLKTLFVEVAHTETKATYAFLHYTMQEFFAALWLLKNPEKIQEVFQQCLTEEKTQEHMKHLIPFMCRLLNEKSPSLMNCLIPAQELKNTSNWFFKEMITTLSNNKLEVDILFLCQCLYESQCPEACVHLLDKLGYHLDLSGGSLDAYPCCAVAYVITQSKERKISLDLEDITVSEQGMTRLFGCLENVQWCDPLPQQLWRTFLLSEGQMDPISLLGLDGNRLHLPVEGKRQLFERAVKVMQKITTKVNVCLHWDKETPVCQSLCESLFEALPHISSFSFRKTYRGPGSQNQEQSHGTLEREEKQLFLDLCLKAANHKGEGFHNVVNMLISLFSVSTDLHNILLDFYQHVKSEGFSAVIPKLRPVFQSAPAVWIINLSERKISILLEVLKLQSEKKQVELRGCSDEESEVRNFLQCLPYVSQLRWASRKQATEAVIQSLPAILKALSRIQHHHNSTPKAASEADGLLSKLSTFEFMFITVAQIRELRTEEAFDSMENTARSMVRESDAATEFAEQRIRKRKRHFDEDAEDDQIEDSRRRFKAEIYFYILDVFVGQFESRFSDFKKMAKLFAVLCPKRFEHPDAEEKMLELARFYSEDMPKPEDAVEEFCSFRALYSELNMDFTTDAVLPFLIANDIDRAYPHLTILHRIYKTLPISSAKGSFSSLRLIKTYLRSCMDEARLSHLTLLCVEREIHINKDKVVGRFATMKERRMKM
ncbi:uncharacterized protein LOC114551258 [Perca flavescens]|uniref:uncharacterized protein LOC114551258 n=1 Tax=Perca flavescens TaxID=8167 RepID=UPI00106E73FA|nr:uncharacterized protein LOC114551258 [Perca flavescens]